jgi:hypothetical protein
MQTPRFRLRTLMLVMALTPACVYLAVRYGHMMQRPLRMVVFMLSPDRRDAFARRKAAIAQRSAASASAAAGTNVSKWSYPIEDKIWERGFLPTLPYSIWCLLALAGVTVVIYLRDLRRRRSGLRGQRP